MVLPLALSPVVAHASAATEAKILSQLEKLETEMAALCAELKQANVEQAAQAQSDAALQ